MSKESRLANHAPRWWREVDQWAKSQGVPAQAVDVLVELIYAAIEESGAKLLGAAGGLKGGPARAAKLSPKQRHVQAVKAARTRWGIDKEY